MRREQGRRRLVWLAAVAAVIALLALAAGSLYSPLLKVRHVRLSVVGNYPASRALVVAGLDHYRLMIDTDPPAIAARLDAVPQLGGALVTKTWPGTVTARVWVRTAVAVMSLPAASGHPQEWALVDATGRVLGLVASSPQDFPEITGLGPPPRPGQWVAGSAGPAAFASLVAGGTAVDVNAPSESATVPRGAAAAFALAALLPAVLRPDVSAITVGVGGQLSVTMLPADIASGDIPVLLGDGSQLASKVTALTALVTQADLSGVTSLNLTVPDRPAALTAQP